MSLPFTPDQIRYAAEQRHHGALWPRIGADLGLAGHDDIHALILAVHDAYPRMTVSLDGPEDRL